MPSFGILIFPGSNCNRDCLHAIKTVLGQPCEMVWHEEESLDGADCVVVPGGFSYGDYLRAGAIARFSPVMTPLRKMIAGGTPVIGICNGFQILVESGLLPGAFTHNSSLRFVCRWTNLRVEDTDTPFTHLLKKKEILKLPVANAQGNFLLPPQEDGKRRKVVLRYCDQDGRTVVRANPSGAEDNIAAIANDNGNILGMMPHPERGVEDILGSRDGRKIFECVISWIESRKNSMNAV